MSAAGKFADDHVRERHAAILRGLVARAERGLIAAQAGIAEGSLTSYMEGRSAPGLPHFLRLAALFGPGYVNDVLALVGLGGVERLEGSGVNPLTLNAGAARLSSLIADHAADGHIDHLEEAEEVGEAKRLREILDGFISQREAKR